MNELGSKSNPALIKINALFTNHDMVGYLFIYLFLIYIYIYIYDFIITMEEMNFEL